MYFIFRQHVHYVYKLDLSATNLSLSSDDIRRLEVIDVRKDRIVDISFKVDLS